MPVELVKCKTAASRSGLPGLDWAVNPYRGCSHACAYCYAQDVTRFHLGRPWGETIEVKTNIVQRLRKELEMGATGVYGVGTVTDPYQSLEGKFELTRGCLSALRSAGAAVSILTKSDLVLRDLDILRGWPGAEVGVSLASLDDNLASLVERGAPSPSKRLDALRRLSEDGVKTYLMAAPIIRGLSDSEDDLRALVRQAGSAKVPVVMWDRFNPKPIATSRLRERLAERDIRPPDLHTREEVSRIRSILGSECRSLKIELLDAF